MKKIIAACLSLALLLGMLPACYAAEDAVSALTAALQSFETEVTVKTADAEGTLQSVFSANPELFYYFDSYSATTSKNGKKSTYTFSYHNTEVASESVFVVSDSSELYNVIGYALAETAESVSMVFTNSALTEDDIISAVSQWHEDYYLAYMGYTGVNATVFTSTEAAFSGWTGYTLQFLYITDGETLQLWREQTLAVVQQLCTSLFALDMPDWEKALLIHDYIVNNCSYNQSAEGSDTYSAANTAYGCLVLGSAVCDGYAEAANLLFRAAGLSSYYVEGAGDSSDHAWNCVELDGEYYWIDVTWDDPVPEEGESENLYHTYFCLTDSELSADHSWQSSLYPSCTATTWNYTAVREQLSTMTDGEGNLTVVYESYSSENVKTISTLVSDLEYSLGVSEVFRSAEEEPEEDETETEESAESGESETESAHPLRGILLRVLLALVLLVAAYLVYRRVMYLRMLRRRKERAAARKRLSSAGTAPRKKGAKAAKPAARKKSARPTEARKPAGRPRRENPFR